jgi:predicted alpha/beta-hydrolase family hydrolase
VRETKEMEMTTPRLARTDWDRLANYNLPYMAPAPKALRGPRLNKAAKPAKPSPAPLLVGRLLWSNRPAA